MPMKTIEGYSKEKYTNTSVLLAGGGAKALSDFIGSLSWDSTNKKIKYTPVEGSATDLVTLSWDNIANKPTSLPANGGDADTVDNYHASNLTKFYLSPMEGGAPADSAKSWFIDTMPSASGAIVYNVPGSEKTIIVGKSSGAYGHMLQLNYDDNYLRILRYQSGSWKTTDWEKISAGYADSAGYSEYTLSLNSTVLPSSTSNAANTVWCKFATITFNASAWCNAAGYIFFSGGEASDYKGILEYHFRAGQTASELGVAQLSWITKSHDYATVIAVKTANNVYDFYTNNCSSWSTPRIYHFSAYNDRFKWNVGSWSTTKPTAAYTASDIGRVYYSTNAGNANYAIEAGTASSAGSVAWANITGKPSTFTPSSHTHPDTFQISNEENYVNLSFRDAALSQKASEKYIECWDGAGGWWNWKANKWIKVGSDDSYVLLGGGGHKLISDFATAEHTHDGRYLRYEGWWSSGSGQNVDDANGMTFVYGDHGSPNGWGILCTFDYTYNSGYKFQLFAEGYSASGMYYRCRSSDRGGWTSWKTVIDDGNIGSQSVNYASNAGDADTLDGYHVQAGHNKPWGMIPAITETGWMDVGKQFEFHYDNTTGSDYSTILRCTGNYSNVIDLPSTSGTLALRSDIPSSLPANGGNADTVDNEHASAFAHIGAHNNLTASGDEFTFASSGFSGNIWINYRTAGGLNGNITSYQLGNGKGDSLGYILTSSNWSSYISIPSVGNDTNYYPIRSYTSGLQISSYSGSTDCALFVPYATSNQAGVVSTEAQIFSGQKTFSSIRLSTTNFGGYLYFGDDSYAYLAELADDQLTLNATKIFLGISGSQKYYIDGTVFRPVTANSTSSSGIALGSSDYRFTCGYFSDKVYAYKGFYESSDERLKNILNPVKVNLDDLSKLRKVYYLWKDRTEDEIQLGMIAQDVQKLYPELVSVDKETGYLSLAYDKLSVLALEAIDVLYKEHKKLKKHVDELEKLLINNKIS